MKIYQKTFIIAGIVLVGFLSIGYGIAQDNFGLLDDSEVVDMISISSNGHYVISSDQKGTAVLWDLQAHSKKIISLTAHSWAAYFIPNTDNFVWQDQDMTIHVMNVAGQTLKTFNPGFLTYGFAITKDLSYYLAGTINQGLYFCHEQQCVTKDKPYSSDPREYVPGKPFNISLTSDEQYFLSVNIAASYPDDPKYKEGVLLYDRITGQKMRDYLGNISSTFATFSPDGNYVVAGDIGSWQFVWDTQTAAPIVRILGTWPFDAKGKTTATSKDLIPRPKDIYDDSIMTIKFIDQTHYLVFNLHSHYAILYDLLNPKPQKYLDLDDSPMPATYHLVRDQATDTASQTHILVMAKDFEPGIMVYQYNPQTQTLKKIWDAK